MPPCIPYLAKNVSPPFILLVPPPTPIPHVWTALPLSPTIPFGENPVDGGRKQPSSKPKNPYFPHQRYTLTKYQSAIQGSFIAVAIAVVSFF